MTTQFSANQDPPTRFRPGPAQTGAQAALEHGRRGGGSPKPPTRPRPTGGGSGGGGIGRPSSEPVQQSNAEHIRLWLRHQNAQSFGRDQPFALWAQHHGMGGGWDLYWDGF